MSIVRFHATPLPLLTTRYGSVPHLTRDTLKHVTVAENAPLLVAYQHHVNQTKMLEKYEKGEKQKFKRNLSLFIIVNMYFYLTKVWPNSSDSRRGL